MGPRPWRSGWRWAPAPPRDQGDSTWSLWGRSTLGEGLWLASPARSPASWASSCCSFHLIRVFVHESAYLRQFLIDEQELSMFYLTWLISYQLCHFKNSFRNYVYGSLTLVPDTEFLNPLGYPRCLILMRWLLGSSWGQVTKRPSHD